jgi:hypothetical protein
MMGRPRLSASRRVTSSATAAPSLTCTAHSTCQGDVDMYGPTCCVTNCRGPSRRQRGHYSNTVQLHTASS